MIFIIHESQQTVPAADMDLREPRVWLTHTHTHTHTHVYIHNIHLCSGQCPLLANDNSLRCQDTNFDPRHRGLRLDNITRGLMDAGVPLSRYCLFLIFFLKKNFEKRFFLKKKVHILTQKALSSLMSWERERIERYREYVARQVRCPPPPPPPFPQQVDKTHI